MKTIVPAKEAFVEARLFPIKKITSAVNNTQKPVMT